MTEDTKACGQLETKWVMSYSNNVASIKSICFHLVYITESQGRENGKKYY